MIRCHMRLHLDVQPFTALPTTPLPSPLGITSHHASSSSITVSLKPEGIYGGAEEGPASPLQTFYALTQIIRILPQRLTHSTILPMSSLITLRTADTTPRDSSLTNLTSLSLTIFTSNSVLPTRPN